MATICIFNRPGVAGAVLQSPPSLIHWPSHPFPPNLQDIINDKPLELGSWNFERMFTTHNMSHVTCHMSCVTCHVSHVMCNMSHVTCHVSHYYYYYNFFFWTKWWSLSGGGLLSTGPTPTRYWCHGNNFGRLVSWPSSCSSSSPCSPA